MNSTALSGSQTKAPGFAGGYLLIDACRGTVRQSTRVVSLAKRPVLFTLVRELAEAWPQAALRDQLVKRAFKIKNTNESLRARLRVEIGRLRSVIQALDANIESTKEGFVLAANANQDVLVLAQPTEEKHSAVLALLADGEAWSSSAIALALGTSQRTVQRTLDALLAAQKIQSFGCGRARRWLSPPIRGFATTLLLPHSLTAG